jgi:hypothetical protein
MNEFKDIHVLARSFFNKNWLILSKREIHIERGFIFKTRKVYSKNQLKKLELVKKSTINMNSDSDDTLGYYLETHFQLIGEMANGKKIKISCSNSGSDIEQLAQKLSEVMECRVDHTTNVRCK